MNENICVRLIVSETTWVRQEWVIVQDFPGHSRGADATNLVLCDIRTVLLFNFHTSSSCSPASYHSSGSGGSANKS